MGINKVILVGNVGKDPEIQYIREDVPVARFTLATSESYKDKDGNRQTKTEWHNIAIWRGLAKVVESYVKKGDMLYLEGKITNRTYEKDGQTRYFTEIVANNMEMLGSRNRGDSAGMPQAQAQTAQSQAPASQPQTSNTESNNTPNFDSPEAQEFTEADDLPF